MFCCSQEIHASNGLVILTDSNKSYMLYKHSFLVVNPSDHTNQKTGLCKFKASLVFIYTYIHTYLYIYAYIGMYVFICIRFLDKRTTLWGFVSWIVITKRFFPIWHVNQWSTPDSPPLKILNLLPLLFVPSRNGQ